ncbi:MAG: hypothetical protein E6Q50_02725 [Lysobacter sp.]|nr:MAG: hypothetical protein E6Q50_02725 [Lysobacter sp.]
MRALAASLVATVVLSACTRSGDAPPKPQTPAPVERVAETPPPAADEVAEVGDAASLIGRTLPPYPQGMSEVQGVCVPGGEQPERICDYGMAVLGREATDGTAVGVYLIASANTDPDAKQPVWRVTDALDAPRAEGGQELQLGGCRLDGDVRNEIVALVRHGDQEYSADVAWAKRLDIASGKFLAVELSRVDCVNAGYGV